LVFENSLGSFNADLGLPAGVIRFLNVWSDPAQEYAMFSVRKSFGSMFTSRRGNEATRRRPLRPTIEKLEDRLVPASLDPIQTKYLALGGAAGFLGAAVTGELSTPYNGGLYQQFQNGGIFYSQATGAHDIYGPIETEFFATGNEKDLAGVIVEKNLGLPVTDESSLSGVSGALTANFQGGVIDWSAASGAHEVHGGIFGDYVTNGSANGVLGLPTSDELTTGSGNGRYNHFQGGLIVWSPATGAHEVEGAILNEWGATSWDMGFLGYPTSDETTTGSGTGRYNNFQNGVIVWSAATGAHEVHGAILSEWANLNYDWGLLGYPTSDETTTGSGTGRYNSFQNGLIVWSPATGAHEVHGAILSEWANTNWDMGILGYPTSDQLTTGSGTGQYNSFQNGLIVWSPASGAHEVHGAILSEWAAINYDMGPLGYPTSDVQSFSGGVQGYFQGGKIVWTAQYGSSFVQTVGQLSVKTGNFSFTNDGIPVDGWAQLTVYSDGSYNFVGHFHDDGFLSFNESIVIGLVSSSGVLYTFTHKGSVAGFDEFWNSSDEDWNTSGTNPALAAGWSDLQQGVQWYWRSNVDWNVSALIQDIENVAKVVGAVVAIV
jgi:uncharacterized protein with LGFP repeats